MLSGWHSFVADLTWPSPSHSQTTDVHGLFFTFPCLLLWAIKFVVGCVFVRSQISSQTWYFPWSWFSLPLGHGLLVRLEVCGRLHLRLFGVQLIQVQGFCQMIFTGTLYFCFTYWNYGSSTEFMSAIPQSLCLQNNHKAF